MRNIVILVVVVLAIGGAQASSIFVDARYAKVNSGLINPEERDFELKFDVAMMATAMPQGLVGRAWFVMQPLAGYEWFGGAGYFFSLIKPNGRIAGLVGVGDTDSGTDKISSYWQVGLDLELRPWYLFFNSATWHRHLDHPDRWANQVILEPLEFGLQYYGWRLGATARGSYTYQGIRLEKPGWEELKVGPVLLCPGRIAVRVYIPFMGELLTGTEIQVGLAFM